VAGVSISGVEIELSQLAQLDIKLNKPHQKGNPLDISASATYHNGYTRDITDLITISGFNAAQGSEQTISVSYTENGITVKGNMSLSETKATFFSTQYLQNLVDEANTLQSGKYTADSFAKLQSALTNAKTVLAQSSPTLTEVGNAYTGLSAAMDSLVLLANIAYKMNVTVNCNSTEASKVTDGTISTSNYWSSLNGNTNVPSAQAELIIDLDGLYDVEAVTVYPYWGGQRIYKYKLLGSTDGENWFSIGENSSDEYVTSNGITHNMQAKTAYVKLVGVSTKVVGRADINNIHICEIQVFGSEANNIALNKTVTSSGSDTSASSSATATSDKINDGDRSTYWDAGKYADSPFATVALDGVYQLDKINVIAYWMRTDNRYYHYTVYTSTDGINYTKVGSKSDKTAETVYGNDFTFTDTVLYAKYIKIVGQYNSANSAFHINEVRAYGTKVDYDQILAKQSLENALNNLPAYNKDDYTKESFEAYEAAVSQAKKALESATAEELIKAQENLEKAIKSLTEIVYDVSYVGLQTGKNSIRFIGYITQNAFDTYNGFDLKITFTDATGKASSYTCPTATVYTELKSKNGVAVSVAAKTSSGTVSLNPNGNSAYLFCHSITNLGEGTYSVSITPIAYEGSETTAFKTASYANITVASNGTVSVTR